MTYDFAFWLSLVLAAAGCTGLLLAGKGKWYGWAVGLAVQPVWATYAIVTHGYGLLLTCLMYGPVNARNLLRWRREQKTKPAPTFRPGAISPIEAFSGFSIIANDTVPPGTVLLVNSRTHEILKKITMAD